MLIKEELYKLRNEMRTLRQRAARAERSNAELRERVSIVLRENSLLTNQVKGLKKENQNLKDKLNSTTSHKNKLAGMIFKSNVKISKKSKSKKKRGAQKNHKGKARKKSKAIDQEVNCFLTNCPHCNGGVKQSNRTYERIVEDIPKPQPVIVTKYIIEKQYCPNCKKHISASPKNTVSYSPFGIDTIIMILTLKYNYRIPLAKIQEYLLYNHQLSLAQGTIQNILHKTKKHFGKKYLKILEEIRKASYKHADETGWRKDGLNYWCWLFMTPTEAFYTIEETRGLGVPDTILTKAPQGVLVRDDYGAYKHLNMAQQSCWVHLLRVSRDMESKEAKKLHQELKRIFEQLSKIIKSDFNEEFRQSKHEQYSKRIQRIINRKYVEKDTLKVQVRIRNQNNNLITALLYPNVPLTNNPAEQQIRPMTVQRKISGGSRSDNGAETLAVNMSIIQTLKLRGKELSSGLRELLITKKHKFSVERLA
jgi:hypothetical protein